MTLKGWLRGWNDFIVGCIDEWWSDHLFTILIGFFIILFLILPLYICSTFFVSLFFFSRWYIMQIINTCRKYKFSRTEALILILLFILFCWLMQIFTPHFRLVNKFLSAVFLFIPASIIDIELINMMRRPQRKRRELERKNEEIGRRLLELNYEISIKKREETDILNENKDLFSQRDCLDKEVVALAAKDPANFRVKIDELKIRIQKLSDAQLEERFEALRHYLEKTDNNLKSLNAERQRFISLLSEINKKLERLRRDDPANVDIRLRVLEEEWTDISLFELRERSTKGNIENFYKEKIIVEKELENLQQQIRSENINKTLFLIERDILKIENITRRIKPHEDLLRKIRAQLKELEIERQNLSIQKDELTKALEALPAGEVFGVRVVLASVAVISVLALFLFTNVVHIKRQPVFGEKSVTGPYESSRTPEKITMASLTKNMSDSDYFIEQSKIFDVPFDIVWTAANKYFAKYKITVSNSDPTKGVLVSAPVVKPTTFLQLPFKIDFYTAEGTRTITPSIKFGGTRSQIFILIERVSENSTKVIAKSFCYKEYASGWKKMDPRLYSKKTLRYIEREVKRQQKIGEIKKLESMQRKQGCRDMTKQGTRK